MTAILRKPALLLVPLMAFLLVFYLLPVAMMLLRSAGEGWSFAPFAEAFDSAITLKVFRFTVQVAVVVTILTLILAYPLAYFIVTTSDRFAALLMAIVLVPFWTSILIRSYAWMVLLGRQGVINEFLTWTGVIDTPIRMLNTTFAVYVGMIHVLLPFMILPILSALKGIDGRLVAAAENLGAGPASVFRHVILPLSMPGVIAGCVLVFVLSLGFYITPALIGGPRDMMISMLIAQKVELYEWDEAAAVAAVLLVLTLAALAIVGRVISLDKIFGRAA
ncbi:MAG: ABC transporter permease [Rhodobacteraceae bacterium]|nr:ABC transporter permease [Paracoccaceae bacterium]MAY47093.1 ABC transporter permease [Paracoccaceae bacterium]